MQDLESVKIKIAEMARQALEMWKLTHEAFMEHDLDILADVLAKENILNQLEKELTAQLIELGRCSAQKNEREKVTRYADIVADIELVGDYCKDILERVEIKIQEKLLFSDDAVSEYNELYKKTEEALAEIAAALDADKPGLVKEVIKEEEHIDKLVDKYRQHHNQRLIEGICSPLGCNMFLNMLDFTAAVYYHAKKIARNLLKVK